MSHLTRSYRYRIVDVFTEQALEGNSLAVFPDASGLQAGQMQKITRELNLSETTFVFPATRSDCIANVRIFTPTREMVFAGHPTVGTSFVLLDEGATPKGADRFALEEKIGPVPVRVEMKHRPLIWLRTPPIEDGRTYERAVCAKVLGIQQSDLLDVTPQLLSAGNPTIFIALKNKSAVDQCSLEASGLAKLRGDETRPMCVFVFTPTPEGAYSRMFAPEYGIVEDPATGSSTGPLAAFMMRNKLISSASGTTCVSEQGTKMGRRSLLHILINGENGTDGIEVGGYVTPVAEAQMKF